MTVLNIILNKIALNLKIFGNSDEVIFQTLGIFEVRDFSDLKSFKKIWANSCRQILITLFS